MKEIKPEVNLRPIDDDEDASWERIEELTKWKPPVEVEA